jgi:glutathione S-transferase
MSITAAEAKAPGQARGGVDPAAIKAKLYGVRGSGPSASAELMLAHKGIPYRRVNLMPIRHRRRLRAKGFPGVTVPALVLDGERVQTNRAIARALDELVPDPPLFPSDPTERAEVEEAERFGDEVLQPVTRRIVMWSATWDPDSVRFHPANGSMLVPRIRWVRERVMPRAFRIWGVSDEVVREHFDELPSILDRLDHYVARGVLNGPLLNAADFQIATLIGGLMGVGDLGAEIGRRPIAALETRVLPRW